MSTASHHFPSIFFFMLARPENNISGPQFLYKNDIATRVLSILVAPPQTFWRYISLQFLLTVWGSILWFSLFGYFWSSCVGLDSWYFVWQNDFIWRWFTDWLQRWPVFFAFSAYWYCKIFHFRMVYRNSLLHTGFVHFSPLNCVSKVHKLWTINSWI